MTSTQPNILTLTFQCIPETFIRRRLFSFSSGYCHNGDVQNSSGRPINHMVRILDSELDRSSRLIKETTYSEREMTIREPGRGQLHFEPHIRPVSCHVASLSWQEPEEELNKLLLMKVSGAV